MEKEIIGRNDQVDLPEFGLIDIPAKIDTGANRSAIHCSQIKEVKIDGIDSIEFHIPLDSSHGVHTFHSSDYYKKKIRSSSGHLEERYVIKTVVVILDRKIHTSFSLSDRSEMKFPILIGRKVLKSKFLVDVQEVNISYKKKYNK